ncbi:MAG: hypothetical protein IJZ68_07060 [Bacteroidaceae bacterium]|nr:hypothetical protein [Bacteroidaceae bacterium]
MNYFNTNYTFDTPVKVVIIFFALVFLVGVWILLSAFLPGASKRVKKNVKSFNKRGKTKLATTTYEGSLVELAQKLSKHIHLTDIERSEMLQALQVTGNPMTPEEYKALCYVSGGIFVGIGLIFLLIGLIFSVSLFNIFGVGGMCLGLFYFFWLKRALMNDRTKVVEGVDKELPRFVSFMNTALQKQNSSILSILERYTPRDETFTTELEQTIADAKTSNFAGAMARWDQRINSDRLKRVVRGLINANNGDDVRVYFAMLERDFNAFEMTMLKQNVKRIPEKMRLPKMLMYSAVALALFFPIIMQVVESFQLFFTAT